MTVAEQQEYFDEMVKATTEHLAYFYCCIRFDWPFARDCVPTKDSTRKWEMYVDNLQRKRLDLGSDGEPLGFLDGLTDIVEIFGEGMGAGEFTRSLAADQNAKTKRSGTAKQVEMWGEGYTREQYKRLDTVFSAHASDIGGEAALDEKQKFILKNVAKWTLKMEKATKEEDAKEAAQWSKIIQDNLASENLRKRDAKPIEDVKLDAMTQQLEKKGLLKDGKQCNPMQMFYILFGVFPECEFCQIRDTDKCRYDKRVKSLAKGIYPYTIDAVDQAMLINENRMRQNEGIEELAFLPDEMRLDDVAEAFAKEPNETEEQNYDKLGLVRMPPKGKGGDKT